MRRGKWGLGETKEARNSTHAPCSAVLHKGQRAVLGLLPVAGGTVVRGVDDEGFRAHGMTYLARSHQYSGARCR